MMSYGKVLSQGRGVHRCALMAVLMLAMAAGCTAPTERLKDGPYEGRGYDYASKGVQITRVYYDEVANKDRTKVDNEWIVIQSDRDVPTRGWWINTTNNVRSYAFPDTLRKSLTIYTRPRTGTPSDVQQSMNLNRYILDRHDLIRIYNEAGKIVTQFQF